MAGFRRQNRLAKYDYSHPGYYFVTICTGNRKEYFGKIEEGLMVLNSEGKIAEEAWLRNPCVYQNVGIDEFIVMPNHIHGIVILKQGKQAEGLHYNLSQIIGSYKNVVAKYIHAIGNTGFGWQPTYYDHVVRKDESLDKIREYIRNNPLKWELDRNNLSNLWM